MVHQRIEPLLQSTMLWFRLLIMLDDDLDLTKLILSKECCIMLVHRIYYVKTQQHYRIIQKLSNSVIVSNEIKRYLSYIWTIWVNDITSRIRHPFGYFPNFHKTHNFILNACQPFFYRHQLSLIYFLCKLVSFSWLKYDLNSIRSSNTCCKVRLERIIFLQSILIVYSLRMKEDIICKANYLTKT